MNGWVSLLIGLAATAVLVVQVTIVIRNGIRARRWHQTEGHVVATNLSRGWDSSSNRTATYTATYAYLGADGRTRYGHAIVSSQLPSGAPFEVLYDPANPKDSQPVRKLGPAYIGPGLLGLLCFLVGVFGIVNGILVLTTGTGIE